MRFDDRVMDIAARQQVGELVANQFADTELTLRSSGGLIALVMTWHFFYKRHARVWPAHLVSL